MRNAQTTQTDARRELSHFAALIENLDLSGKKVLEVGCGDGEMAEQMIQRGAQILALECSTEMLASLALRANVPFLNGRGECLPVPDNAFDMVIYINALHHVPLQELDKALAEAARVLRRNGLLYVAEPECEGLYYEITRLIDDETDLRRFTHESLLQTQLFHHRVEKRYWNPKHYPSFDAFMRRSLAIRHERSQAFSDLRPQLESLFHEGARTEGGFGFLQPMRLNLLCKR